ncbi:MAG: glycosyltransferase family 4 protein [Thermodesulfobacteriota bacterium]
MKILYVIDNLEFGGGEKGFLQIIKGLDKEKYTIYTASKPYGEFGKKLGEMRIHFEPVNMENRFNPFTILKLMRIIKKECVHIVHSQGARADFFSRVAVRGTRRSHLVSTIQMPVEGYDVSILRKKIYRIFDRFSERFVDRFIVVSESLKKTLIDDRRIPLNKVIKIYNGVELDAYTPDVFCQSPSEIRKKLEIKNEIFVIGTIGRMVWQKGFEYLIEAASNVIKEYPEARFLIVGEGPLKGKLKVKSKELRVEDKVIFTGFRTDIKEVLSAIDIIVIPSLLEGFPMITLEAMAMAKPIIATNINGITEQITDGINGILIPPKNPSAIAQAIITLINNREKAKEMGLAARKKVEEEFSIEKMVSEIEKVYFSLMETN